jgi:hypothetical protein
MPASQSRGDDDAASDVTAPAPAPAATVSAGGITFNVTFNEKTYAIEVNAPGANGAYGFNISEGETVVAALTYTNETTWEIQVGLPAAFKIDDNLTINAMTVDIKAAPPASGS